MNASLTLGYRLLLAFILSMSFAFAPSESFAAKKKKGDSSSSSSSDSSGRHLKKDGTPDMRYKENREAAKPRREEPRRTETRREEPARHVKKDGTPDRRYKENRDVVRTEPRPNTTVRTEKPNRPLKKDGTPDMRYKENRDAASRDEKRSNNNTTVRTEKPNRPLKKDGTPDMRYKENRDAAQRDENRNNNNNSVRTEKPNRPLKKDGTPDMRFKENRDLKNTVVDPKTKRLKTAAPRSDWKRDQKGRYVDPQSGRPLNNDGSFDMRRLENKDLGNRDARVRIGKYDNRHRANEYQTRVRHSHRHKTVINYNYTVVYNTYIINNRSYGSWGWQDDYYRQIRWGVQPSYCVYACSWYGNYWNPWINQYDYYPSYYLPYRPIVLSDADLAVGLLFWLYSDNRANRAYNQGYEDGYDDASYERQRNDYYEEALTLSRPVEEFQYPQVYMPTEDFVELAKDLTGASANVTENFMGGLTKLTRLIERDIQQANKVVNGLPYQFLLRKHDIDIRLAENHGNELVVLKGQIDRREAKDTNAVVRADFTASIDLRTGEVKLFILSTSNGQEPQATPDRIRTLQDINQQIEEVDSRLGIDLADQAS
jgi:hypothetical protein